LSKNPSRSDSEEDQTQMEWIKSINTFTVLYLVLSLHFIQ